jgi:hypothetical protein
MKTARRFICPVIVRGVLAMMIFTLVPGLFGQETGKWVAGAVREDIKQGRAKLPFAKGTIESLDLLRHQFKLKTNDSVATFTYGPNTYIFRGKEKIAPDGLKTGETIAVRFVTDADGQTLVTRIKAYGILPVAGAESPAPAEPVK